MENYPGMFPMMYPKLYRDRGTSPRAWGEWYLSSAARRRNNRKKGR